MHYVYLTNNVVTDQAQVDPFSIFSQGYAAGFIEAPDEVTFGWSLVDGGWVAPPAPDYTQANKLQAEALLSETDFTQYADVIDPAFPPYLTNSDEFKTYRNQVRVIALDPPATLITDWPIKPANVWSE